MIRGVFLDAGNTLIHERSSRAAIYCEVARAHGLHIQEERMAEAMTHALQTLPARVEGQFRFTRPWFRHFIEVVFARCGATASEELVAGLFAAFSRADHYQLFEDVLPALRELRERRLKIAVVSNWAPHLPQILADLGVARFLEAIVVSAVEGVEKPAAEIFLRAAHRVDLSPGEILHVGDRPDNDVDGALDAGLRATLLDRHRSLSEHPELRCTGLLEIFTFLD
jgi:REG-2-like HAD superfamily hydrolase